MGTRRRGRGEDHQSLSSEPLLPPDKRDSPEEEARSDTSNIALLFLLYLLQGIPLGLTAAVPMILLNRGASYKQQAEFSFVYWPFSLKLLWAPIVDSCFAARFGRRKTWLIPTQYLLGLFMLILSTCVDSLLGEGTPNVPLLTVIFFCLNFLAATQDIAVDGWALTMLKRSNVGHASTCNSVGQTAGYFLGYVLFMALESADFCNTYLRSVPEPEGIFTLAGFLYFWGIVFLVTTTLVGFFKSEKKRDDEEEHDLGVGESYQLLWTILKLPSIKTIICVLLTCRVGFAACDAVTGLKLVERGVPKEKLALIAVPLVPLQIILPLVISKYTAGPRPMDVYVKAIPYRLFMGLVAALMVWVTPYFTSDGSPPFIYYVGVVLVYAVHQVSVYSMFVAVMAFFAQVSDPAVGGTYMTLLNTVANLGGNWPSTLALWGVDSLTWRTCEGGTLNGDSCVGNELKKLCTDAGGVCNTEVDGYYVESFFCVILGLLWLTCWGKRTIRRVQGLGDQAWQVIPKKTAQS
ncbi:acetyl-coenzyme A transporter 1 isoform X2 [Neocloeon triangulifer]|nr:acetyl-coenzyme A transporter 1 isoform X2 [Neocloeon triangulifer]XP_059477305.1 acetyl-coenzyme A transporter 1 isoform X2 [Neocloeon triangulifer]XP_059477313.1 acetyl-coenzyme A transporter 1 isoform X2 [Neocloeon triangulifer]XP_059477322.1 acetyl-coenzyme A transporter 1 isoform X2 [Neocloeon triangulifer]